MRDHPLYEKWRKLSKKVRFWIINQLHRSVVLELIAAQEDKTYADDTFQAAIKHVRRYGVSAAPRIYKRAISMRREHFGTAEEYITAFGEEVRLANELGCTITPYCACIMMLEQLSRDLPHWTAVIEARSVTMHRRRLPCTTSTNFASTPSVRQRKVPGIPPPLRTGQIDAPGKGNVPTDLHKRRKVINHKIGQV